MLTASIKPNPAPAVSMLTSSLSPPRRFVTSVETAESERKLANANRWRTSPPCCGIPHREFYFPPQPLPIKYLLTGCFLLIVF